MWARLISFARIFLGMSRDEFLDTTPRYFDQLCRQYARRRRAEEGPIAQLTAVVLASSYRAPEQRVQAAQFYLTADPDAKPAAAPKRRRKQDIADEVRSVFGAFARQE